MKKVALGIIFLALIGISTFAFFKPSHPSISSTPIPQQKQLCQQNQIEATIESQGAAGSIYGKLSMKNTSEKSCHINLGNSIRAISDATNISIKYKEETNVQDFVLDPGNVVYSQVHYPNGPQCQSGISPKEITFSYSNITFSTVNQTPVMIQSCSSSSEQTVVDIWPLSETPITR